MPLETASTINQLVATNPVVTDGIGVGDDHIRLLKSTIKATFPNLTGAVTASHTAINSTAGILVDGVLTVPAPAAGAVNGGRVVLAGAGVNPSITLANISGALQVLSGATSIATLGTAGDLTLAGWLTATTLRQLSNILMPTGCVIMWSGSVATIPAGWALCNGAGGTVDLRDRFVYGAGLSVVPSQVGGSHSFSVSGSVAGAHNHAGLTASDGAHTPLVTADAQGSHSHAGTQATTLDISQIPYHDHNLSAHTLVRSVGGTGNAGGAGNFLIGDISLAPQGGGLPHVHGISADGSHVHVVTAAPVGPHGHAIPSESGHQHVIAATTTPPFYALAYIQKT